MSYDAEERIASLTSKVATGDRDDEPDDDEIFAELERELDEDPGLGGMREKMMEKLKQE